MNSLGKQRTLAMMTGFERYTKKTRRAIFLEEMEHVVPWAKLCAVVEPHYPKPGNGRRPKELEQMLRLISAQSRCLTRPRSASSGTCWKNTIWGRRFLGQ